MTAINPDTDPSVWGVSPSVFRSMVVIHTTVKFRDTFGTLEADEISWLTDQLMDGFYSFNFVDALESIGVENMNQRIRNLLDTYKTLGDNK